MRKKRFKLVITMAVMLCYLLGTATILYAHENEAARISDESGYSEMSHAEEDDIQPRAFCLNCGSMMQMWEVCLPWTRRAEGTRDHKYGFLGQNTCTVTTYTANAAYYCDVCEAFYGYYLDDEQSDGLARHYCIEDHSACDRGHNYVICPFGG